MVEAGVGDGGRRLGREQLEETDLLGREDMPGPGEEAERSVGFAGVEQGEDDRGDEPFGDHPLPASDSRVVDEVDADHRSLALHGVGGEALS